MNQAMISPSIMCAPQWQDISGMLNLMKASGVELIHVDVMDGQFVPNFMLGTESVRQLRKICPIPLDIHLMIEEPDRKWNWFDIQPGEYVSVHAESTHHLQRVLAQIKQVGAHPMVALNPGTPIIMLEDVLADVDGVLLMTVNPGFAGQKMVPQMIDKIARLRQWLDQSNHPQIKIEVDGNVSFENAIRMRKAGADIFVCGTASLFSKDGNLAEHIAHMRECISPESSAANFR